jgi:hypothetical protein
MAKLNITRASTSRMAVVFLPDSASTTGAGKTALTNASAGLNVSVRREKSSAVTTYSGANILGITTLGTWADPGAGKVRFKEIDATNQPGMYELQFVDSLVDASDTSRYISGMIQATGIAPTPFELALDATDAQNAASGGMTNLDAAVSSRSSHTAAQAATSVWTDLLASSDFSTAASIGKLLKDDIDATISSRSTYAGGDTAGTTTLLGRLTAGRATNLDNLDALVSSRLATAGYTAPPTTGAIATAIWQDLTAGADFGTAGSIGKLLKTMSFDANGNINSNIVDAGGNPATPLTTADIAAAVWDLTTTGHTTSGTFGAAMNAAGSAGDPWATALPGAYGAGTAGNILGNRLDAAISTRSTYAGADTAGTTTLLTRLTSGRATNLDNLDAAISSRLATAGYTAAPTAAAVATAVFTTAMAESYAADGATFTLAQAQYMLWSLLQEFAIVGNTITSKKLDGTTTAMVHTLDSATDPRTRTRAS